MAERLMNLISIEGRRVNVALRNGTRIDDCELVSSGRAGLDSVWLFTNGEDVFVRRSDLIDVWESPMSVGRAA